MENITQGKAFNRQVAFLEANDVSGLITTQYAAEAELVGFDLQVKGTEALLKHFTGYLANLGGLKLISTEKFMETGDAIMFEASIMVAAGVAQVTTPSCLKMARPSTILPACLDLPPNLIHKME